MKKVLNVVLAAAAVAVMAVPAVALDKLKVLNGGGATVFDVTDAGEVAIGKAAPVAGVKVDVQESVTPQTSIKSVEQMTVGTTLRYKLQNNGAGFWWLQSGQPSEPDVAALLGYVTPAGYGGIAIIDYRNNQGTTASRMNLVNYGPTFSFYSQNAYNLPTLNVTHDDKVGIGVLAPKQKFEVNGGIRLYPQAVTNNYPVPPVVSAAPAKPNCDATNGPDTRGTLWFTNGGTAKDSLQVCAYDGTSYAWRTIY